MRTIILAALLAATTTAATAEIVTEPLRYSVGDAEFEALVARNDAHDQSRGTVLIVHDWDGLTGYEQRRAEMLAAEGYTAIALDVYGADVDPQSIDEYRALSGALYRDRAMFRDRLMGAIQAARGATGATEGMVMIGYCFGGAAVLEAARAGADLNGFVGFHSGLGTPEGQSYADVKAPIALFHGSADPVSGMADLAATLDQLQAAGVEHDATIFGGARHSFTVFGSRDYDLEADRGAWAGLQRFLAETL